MKKSNSGFTLIELLLSLAIFSIMAVAVYSAFATGIGVWRKAKEVSTTYQTARLILEEVAEDLRNTVMITGSEFVGEPDRISFLKVRYETATGASSMSSEIRRITYEIKRDEASPFDALYRLDESYVEGLQGDHHETNYLAGPIAGFDLQYAAIEEEIPIEWKTVWEEESLLPIGVKITLTMPGSQEEAILFTKTVFIPQAEGLKKERENEDEG